MSWLLPFRPYPAWIIGVVDGDTIDALVDQGLHHTTEIRLRLAGIDTPEKFGAEKVAGLAAKEALTAVALGYDVTVVLEKDRTEKYGRFLATVILDDGTNVNRWLIEKGYADVYMGGPPDVRLSPKGFTYHSPVHHAPTED